ncbi:sigma-70 family RNA polymerase sigma factor [Listeria monocytogenes]|nr:sigma-70 family RNA polymerase sigma factor [Listeria monocytogenes]
MSSSLFQAAIEMQFDYICKRAIDDECKDYLKSLVRLSKKEVAFSELDEYMVEQFASIDQYPSDFSYFELEGEEIAVKSMSLGEALEHLPEKKQKIVLFYYFLEMTDAEIANLMGLSHSTVNEHRHKALCLIRKFMKEDAQ